MALGLALDIVCFYFFLILLITMYSVSFSNRLSWGVTSAVCSSGSVLHGCLLRQASIVDSCYTGGVGVFFFCRGRMKSSVGDDRDMQKAGK